MLGSAPILSSATACCCLCCCAVNPHISSLWLTVFTQLHSVGTGAVLEVSNCWSCGEPMQTAFKHPSSAHLVPTCSVLLSCANLYLNSSASCCSSQLRSSLDLCEHDDKQRQTLVSSSRAIHLPSQRRLRTLAHTLFRTRGGTRLLAAAAGRCCLTCYKQLVPLDWLQALLTLPAASTSHMSLPTCSTPA
jgi:hypothetical protein